MNICQFFLFLHLVSRIMSSANPNSHITGKTQIHFVKLSLSLSLFEKNELYNYYQVQNTDVFVCRALFRRGGKGSRKFRPEAEIVKPKAL